MSSQPINSLAILAPGLLGGSLAKALCNESDVRIWGRNAEKLKPLQKEGFSLVSNDLREVISGAELIVLAMPIGSMPEMARRLVEEAGLEPNQLVTDVGSVKASVVDALQPILGQQGYSFLGSHPMAGSEATGYAASSPSLFQGASCILTPDEFTHPDQLSRLEAFWESVGSKVFIMSPEDHDEVVSRVSHLPHILAAVCARVALTPPENGRYAGNGLRDTSRIASGDPLMWEGIISENREALLPHLSEAIAHLKAYEKALLERDASQLQSLLTEDKHARDTLY